MKKHLAKFITHPLISGSSIVFVGSFIASVLSYLFVFLMGRFLSVTDFGLLVALTSALALFGIFPTAFTSIFAKFAAAYNTNKDNAGLTALTFGGLRVLSIFSVVLFVFLLLVSPLIVGYLHISDIRLLLITAFLIILSVYTSLYLGVLQGQMRFFLLSFINMLGPVLRIIFSLLALYLSYRLLGVFVATLLSGIIPLLIVYYILLKKNNHVRIRANEKEFIKELRKYGVKFFLSSIGLTLFTSLDIILVRHFFDATTAGQYAALAYMGKAIFYLTAPIYFVFFPLIAQKKEKKESVLGTLILAAGIISASSILLSAIYYLFPNLILHIFFPAKEYMVLNRYLGFYSLYIFLFSLSWLFSSFFLSLGKTEIYKINVFCSVLFVVSLSIFHSGLFQVVLVQFIVALVLLVLLLVYFRYYERD